MDKAKKTLRDVVVYADEVARDEQLRAAIRRAAGHGSDAGERVQKNIAAGSATTRLAHDAKLRRDLKKMLNDLDTSSDRLRRKNRHRLRNALLAIFAAVGALGAFFWARERMSDASEDGLEAGGDYA
jgi:hypothetical protein